MTRRGQDFPTDSSSVSTDGCGVWMRRVDAVLDLVFLTMLNMVCFLMEVLLNCSQPIRMQARVRSCRARDQNQYRSGIPSTKSFNLTSTSPRCNRTKSTIGIRGKTFNRSNLRKTRMMIIQPGSHSFFSEEGKNRFEDNFKESQLTLHHEAQRRSYAIP